MSKRSSASGSSGAAKTCPGGLEAALQASLDRAFGGLRRSVRKNLGLLTLAFFQLLGSARSGQGRLSLAALSRCWPTPATARAREKRLHRFLANPRLDPRAMTDGLVALSVGQRGSGVWPLVFDQTKAGSTQALLAGVPWQGRVLPLGVITFPYPWSERVSKSQNELEETFLLDVETALPAGVRPLWIGDRGYARAALLRRCAVQNRLYLIRGRGGTQVRYDGQTLKLKELTTRPGEAIRYRNVLYQAQQRVRMDVVAFHDPAFAEPWWLLVSPDQEDLLPTDTVVALYRERMQIEQGFRDFKTHLGLRGLQLKQQVVERTGRLLLAFCLAYTLAIVLGAADQMAETRRHLEVPRRKARHGTRRTLSVLSLALIALSHPRWRGQARRCLRHLLHRLARGEPLLPPTDLLSLALTA